jgi:prepilin peptidase CpaA
LNTLTLVALSILPALVIVAALRDLTTMTIPNWISGLLILAFYPTAWLVGLSPMAMLIHTGVGLAALFIGAGLFALRVIGGGDAKLLAAVALWVGLAGAGGFILFTALAGGLFSLVLIAARGRIQPSPARTPDWLMRLLQPKGDIPYGVAIAIGALAAFPSSGPMAAFGLA